MNVRNYRLNTSEAAHEAKKHKQWNDRMLKLVANKMGISVKQFVKKMYQNSPNGDWTVFADEAKKLRWIDNIIKGIRYTHISTQPQKKQYNSKKLLLEILDLEDDQLKLNSKDGKSKIDFIQIPGDYTYMKKNTLIKINRDSF